MATRRTMQDRPGRGEARRRLLDAALAVIRQKGYSAATVDDLCAAAGVTKGAFFHHFASKDELGVAAAEHWSALTGELFAAAPYRAHGDPLARVLAYLDFRKDLLRGAVAEFTCLAGTMVQETFDTHPAIRDACAASIRGHAATLAHDLELAIAARGVTPDGWTAEGLALHTQAVLQGAFVLCKCDGGPELAAQSIDHLRRYLELLFRPVSSRSRLRERP